MDFGMRHRSFCDSLTNTGANGLEERRLKHFNKRAYLNKQDYKSHVVLVLDALWKIFCLACIKVRLKQPAESFASTLQLQSSLHQHLQTSHRDFSLLGKHNHVDHRPFRQV